jgi:hypothetical protein
MLFHTVHRTCRVEAKSYIFSMYHPMSNLMIFILFIYFKKPPHLPIAKGMKYEI